MRLFRLSFNVAFGLSIKLMQIEFRTTLLKSIYYFTILNTIFTETVRTLPPLGGYNSLFNKKMEFIPFTLNQIESVRQYEFMLQTLNRTPNSAYQILFAVMSDITKQKSVCQISNFSFHRLGSIRIINGGGEENNFTMRSGINHFRLRARQAI